MTSVLFLCTGNSCRSQMAEGLVNHFLDGQWVAHSAGTEPSGYVHSLAVQAMFPPTSADEMRGRPGNVDKFGQPNMVGSLGEYDFPGIWDYLMERLLAISEYVDLFHEAYPAVPVEDLGFQHAANAIAARALCGGLSPRSRGASAVRG